MSFIKGLTQIFTAPASLQAPTLTPNAVFEKLWPRARLIMKDIRTSPVKPKMLQFYKMIDEANASKVLGTACKQGCSYCCNYRVMVSAPEVFAITEHMKEQPRSFQEIVVVRINANADIVRDMPPEEYERTNIECAFLSEGSCSIYSVRPSACRSHHAMDARICQRVHANPMSLERNIVDPQLVVNSNVIRTIKMSALNSEEADATWVEMHAAVSEALSGSSPRSRWRNKQFAFVRVKDRQ